MAFHKKKVKTYERKRERDSIILVSESGVQQHFQEDC